MATQVYAMQCKGLDYVNVNNVKDWIHCSNLILVSVICLNVNDVCISLDVVWCSWVSSYGTWKSIQQLGKSLKKVELTMKFTGISGRSVLNSDICFFVGFSFRCHIEMRI